MITTAKPVAPVIPGRVTSVDFFRGITMFLLVGESTRLYEHFLEMDSSIMQFFGLQFSHQGLAWTSFLGFDTTFLYVHRWVSHSVCSCQQIKKGTKHEDNYTPCP